jgi:hypothetical protein
MKRSGGEGFGQASFDPSDQLVDGDRAVAGAVTDTAANANGAL